MAESTEGVERSGSVLADRQADETSWGAGMLQTALRTYDPRALAQSYLAHAQKDLREQVEKVPGASGAGPRRKKYLNILRSLLSAQELYRSGALTPFKLLHTEADDSSAGSNEQDEEEQPQEVSSSDWAPPINLQVQMQSATLWFNFCSMSDSRLPFVPHAAGSS